MKKYAPWAAVVVVLIVVLALLLAPKLSATDDTNIPTPTPIADAVNTEASTSDATTAPEGTADTQAADDAQNADSQAVSSTVADESDDQTIMATVNGQSITYADVDAIAQTLLYSYSQYGYDTSSEDFVNSVYEMSLEYAVQLEIMEQKAAEWGFDQMTEEEKATAESEVTAEWEDLIDTYILYYVGLADDATDEEKAAARVTAIAGLEAMGYTYDILMQDYADSMMFEKVEAEIVKSATVTDEEILEAFNEQVEADKETYAADVAMYEYMTQYYGQTCYYQPEGYRGITHILLSVDDELLNTYQELAAELEEQQEAAEEASITDLEEGEVVTQADVDAAYAAVIASVQPTIDEINQKLADGVSFDDLIAEYGQDPGMQSEPYKSEGYSVHMDSVIWDPAFVKAAFSVDNVGDIAEPVLGSYGVHIVKYHRDVPAGAVELTDDVKASIRESLLSSKENDLFDATMTEWMNTAAIEYANAADDAE